MKDDRPPAPRAKTRVHFIGLHKHSTVVAATQKRPPWVQTLALAPWLLLPGLLVIVAVLAFNLVGDGLRDASDPYGK